MSVPTRRDFELRGLDHLVLRVVDLPKMLHFYVDILGCRVEREQAEIGLTQLRVDSATLIDLVTVDGVVGRRGGAKPQAEGRNVDHFCIRISPYDESSMRDYCERVGLKIVESGPRYGAVGETDSIYVEDPEGNIVELKSDVN